MQGCTPSPAIPATATTADPSLLPMDTLTLQARKGATPGTTTTAAPREHRARRASGGLRRSTGRARPPQTRGHARLWPPPALHPTAPTATFAAPAPAQPTGTDWQRRSFAALCPWRTRPRLS